MRLWIALTSITFIICATLVLMLLLPPKQLTLAAGTQGGAYALIAQRYQQILARDSIEVEILYTDGSAENAALMAQAGVDVALLQAGIEVPPNTAEAIGSVFYEPMIFMNHTSSDVPANPALWRGLRIASGTAGSGTAVAFVDFQRAVGLKVSANSHVSLGSAEAIDALKAGEIDLAVFVTSIEAPYLAGAYESETISFLKMSFVEAISRRLEYANIVDIPKGAIALDPVRPAETNRVLALQARLAISPNLHPALVNRLTMAAKELHGQRDLITNRGVFPSVEGTGLPVNNVARQLIQQGPSTWHNLLPYWMAAQVNRLLLLTLPILLVLVPMFRILPMIYAYFRGWQVWQHYGKIRQIEDKLARHQDAQALAEMDAELERLDAKLALLKLPAAYRQAAYHARMHVELVRKRIRYLTTAASRRQVVR